MVNDGFVNIGNVESLSFGFQSESEIIESMNGEFNYRGKIIHFNTEAMIDAYFEGRLAKDFYNELQEKMEEIAYDWGMDKALEKIEELEEYFSEDGEYWQELKEMQKENEEYWQNIQKEIEEYYEQTIN